MSINVLTVFGTRPEAIKMAPLVLALANEPAINAKVAVTAQHREMLDQVLNLFEIAPDCDLNIMSAGQDLYDVTAKVLLGMRDILKELKPDLVLIHGDTTTCFAAGLAAFYAGIKVGHVEAGLRTYDLKAPFPEEANRTLAGVFTDYHFAPTEGSRKNLEREHVDASKIIVTGNTVIDALLLTVEKLKTYSEQYWMQYFNADLLGALSDTSRRMVLITGHRRENFGQGFIDLCMAIKQLAMENADVDFVYPVHLNPNVQKPVKEILSDIRNVHLIEPLDYLPFVYLMEKSHFILTDSGGVQEEAPTLGKPVLVMRDVTERPEAVAAGTVKLVGTNREKIVMESNQLLHNQQLYEKMASAHNPYGDGLACARIIDFIKKHA